MAASKIFSKPVLSQNALRTVADRRFSDAAVLRDTKQNAHANGAMYLAGFVIECLLKAHMLAEHPWLATANYESVREDEYKRQVWGLCYRSHDLDLIYAHLPKLRTAIDAKAQLSGPKPSQTLREVFAWSIFARYASSQATSREARDFLEKVRELKGHLNG